MMKGFITFNHLDPELCHCLRPKAKSIKVKVLACLTQMKSWRYLVESITKSSMSLKRDIPSFDFTKSLETGLPFHYERLERSYHAYDASHAHRHNYYEILFFEEEGGVHEIDFCPFGLNANAAHPVSPGQIHVLKREPHVTGSVISFTSELFLTVGLPADFIPSFPFFEPFNTTPIIDLTKDDLPQIHLLIGQLRTEFQAHQCNKPEMLALLTSQLLFLLKRSFRHKEELSGSNDLLTRYKNLIKQHFLEHRTVQEYADRLAISPGHLNDSVRNACGKSAKDMIQEQLVLEAKRMLYHSNYSIKEIAVHLGFDDPSYFNRFFRLQTGQTPTAFRELIREKYH